MTDIENPFENQGLEEIHLPNAPLIRVIAQVRFPTIVSIEDAKFIAQFQESLRHEYPILKSEKSIVVNLLNLEDRRETTIWRFFDKNEKWRITLSPEFLALESIEYKSRKDFFGRFSSSLSSLYKHIKPDSCERIGVRYIDQVKGPEFRNITNLVRPEVLDVYRSNLQKYVASSVGQTLFTIDSHTKLNARYGVLGKKQTYDTSSINAIDEESWILDLDVFSEMRQEFKCDVISKRSEQLSDYAYKFFRWTVQDEFLITYGGSLK